MGISKDRTQRLSQASLVSMLKMRNDKTKTSQGNHLKQERISRRDFLNVNALGDKLLLPNRKISYLLFFEADQRYAGCPWDFFKPKFSAEDCFEIFPSKNGFHIIGSIRGTAETKKEWYQAWKKVYPKSDYILNNWNWLAPHTEDELDFILNVAFPVQPRVVRYYRDKRVWETIGIRRK